MAGFFVDPDIAKAKTLDTTFYTSDTCYNDAKERIFAASWQLAGHTGEIATAGSALPFTLLPGCLDEPLVLVNDSGGRLRCLSNVCTHRGNLLVTEKCALRSIRCRYHGRQFALDGRFVSMPEFKEVLDFPAESDHLATVPLYRWGNLVFANLVPGLDAATVFGPMTERMSWFPMGDLVFRQDLSRDYHVSANWALYCENYLEGFHIPFVHEGLNQELDFGAYTTELFGYSNLQLGIGKYGESCFDLPESAADFGRQVAAYYFWVFPNMMFNFYPWGLSINHVLPQGKDRCKVAYYTYVLDETKLGSGAGAGLDTVELEDEEIVEQVQRGIQSRFYRQGRYSVLRETGTHHFHSLIAKFMNK
jgi:choline monooxygenase